MTHCTKKFLGLKDENITLAEDWLEERLIKGEKTHIIKASLTYQPKACLKCGLVNQGEIVKNGTHTIQAQLLPYRNQRTILELKKTRFLCRACGCTFNAQTPLIEENCQLSKELVYKVAHDLKRNLSRKDIAAMNFVSDATVQRVLRRVTNWFRPNFKFLPTVLCVDEFRSLNASKNPMSFIFMDGDTNQIIEILENRQLAFLKYHFLRYSRQARLRVKYLVMDMNAPYAQLIKEIFPNAQIIVDRFHIIQHINRSFNQLRVNVMKTFRTGDKDDQRKYRLIKSHWKLLLKDSFALNSTDYHYNRRFRRPMSQKAIVDELLSFSEPLRIAYETCQRLYYHYQTKNSDAFFEEISTLDKRLPNWFCRKLTFFKRYENGIRNAFRYSYSNGPLEGVNNKIKVIKRVAYGYRNFLNLRARIYLIQGLIFKEERLPIA